MDEGRRDQPVESRPGRGVLHRVLDVVSTNPWEMFLEIIQDFAWIRRVFFAIVLALCLVWASWTITAVVAGLWAFHEAAHWLRRNWR
jgi:hypothetical protein